MGQGRILFIEDDADIREIMTIYMTGGGLQVDAAESAEAGWELFRCGTYDLVLSDIVLPDRTGTELAGEIRKQSNVPIIFISCKKESSDIVDGLELGADDYITKPFEPSVVVARVKAQLRRYQDSGRQELEADSPPAGPIWHDGRLRIDPARYEVSIDDKPVTLFAKERQLLLFMAGHPNRVFSVEQLYGQVWGWDRASDQRTVMVHIRTLRTKIEKNPAEPAYLVTVRGFGYKFCWGGN
ncbi:response regulator transcription factor [Paenibacillus chartarius]|uniref:Response regulator transcription factor n=1 Tax=Paenibacillus chartarius TaxID=747481 RepID=A0ABV6DHQ3_9BACL